MSNNWKGLSALLLITAFIMSAVIIWDISALKTDVTHWSYVLIKGVTIGFCYVAGVFCYLRRLSQPWVEDTYAILFHIYSWYGMAYIDMTYSFSFLEIFVISALFLRQTPIRFLSIYSFGAILMLAGYAMATEPDFIAPGDSYKPHSLTISSIFFALGLGVYFIIMRYQRKVIDLNEKFALIGKQSSFLMHEIKNPLNRVVANSSHEFSTELMEDIRRDSQKISGLVSSIETLIHHPEQLTRTFVRFDLSETKDNLLKEYDLYAKSMNITLELNELKGSFYGNKYLIYQLIKNLILNAIEAIGYRKDESCLIKVSALKDEKDVNLTVTNTGSRITTRDIGLIFEPHFTTKKNGTNKGLGLTLAKSIVEAHFGKISVYSTENSVSIESLIPDYTYEISQRT